MEWKELTTEEQILDIVRVSEAKAQVIFKHSTRCSISSVAKGRLDRATAPSDTDFYYLDLVRYRNISNKIAEVFKVRHESPQVLVIRNGECIYDESHMGINMQDIAEKAW